LVVEVDGSSAFNEEGDEYLHAVEEESDFWVGEGARPYAKFFTLCLVGLDSLARGLEVFHVLVILDCLPVGCDRRKGI